MADSTVMRAAPDYVMKGRANGELRLGAFAVCFAKRND